MQNSKVSAMDGINGRDTSIFRIPSGPAVSVPQRKGRIHDCKLYRRFKSVSPLQHRGRPYMTARILSREAALF